MLQLTMTLQCTCIFLKFLFRAGKLFVYDSSTKACQNVLLQTVFLNSSTPKMFVSAQSAFEPKKIRKATKFTSLKYPSKPCVNKPTETLRESPIQYQAFGLLLTDKSSQFA